MINKAAKSQFSKLLAQEDLTVVYENVKTASFNGAERILTLPVWDNMSVELHDMFSAHEVGHALITPRPEDKIQYILTRDNPMGVPHGILNALEDVRVDRHIKKKYPGLKKAYIEGCKELFDRDFYGLRGRDIAKLSVIDRINLFYKGGALMGIPFTDYEKDLRDRAFKASSYADVAALGREVYEYMKNAPEPEGDESEEEEDGDNSASVEPSDSQSAESQESESEPVELDFDPEDADDGSDSEESESGDTDESEESGEGEESASNADGESDDGEEGEADGTSSTESSEDGEEDDSDQVEGDITSDGVDSTPAEGTDSTSPNPVEYEEGDEDMGAETADNLEKNIDEQYGGGDISVVREFQIYNLNKHIEKRVLDYKRVKETIIETKSKDSIHKDLPWENMNEYQGFLSENRGVINHMANEFNRKKSAQKWARTKSAKSGSLDVNKLHQYKYSDDLFARVQKVAKGKNHGIIMIVDWSGSMENHLYDTIVQTLVMVSFCRRVGIPHRVLAFSDVNVLNKRLEPMPEVKDTMVLNNLGLIELFTSDMRKKDFAEAAQMWLRFSSGGADIFNRAGLGLGATPLAEAVLASFYIYNNFKSKTNADIITTVWLTDGEGHGFAVYGDNPSAHGKGLGRGDFVFDQDKPSRPADSATTTNLLRVVDPITKESRSIKCKGNYLSHWNKQTVQQYLLELYKIRSQGPLIGYRVTSQGYNSICRACPGSWTDKSEVREIRKNGFKLYEGKNVYDQYYVVLNKNLKVDSTDLADMVGKKKVLISNEFKRQGKAKKSSRMIATKIAELVA